VAKLGEQLGGVGLVTSFKSLRTAYGYMTAGVNFMMGVTNAGHEVEAVAAACRPAVAPVNGGGIAFDIGLGIAIRDLDASIGKSGGSPYTPAVANVGVTTKENTTGVMTYFRGIVVAFQRVPVA